jgi:hypothetical protein
MKVNRAAILAVLGVLGSTVGAGAQNFGPATAFGPVPGFGPSPSAAPPSQGANCMTEFVPMRQEAEKRASALQAAASHKAAREEVCNLFKRFSEAEGRIIKYLVSHQAACGIPAEAISNTKANHAKTMATEHKICSAEGMEARPRGTGLGEALGVRAVPTPETTKTGKGIFDTLSSTQVTE